MAMVAEQHGRFLDQLIREREGFALTREQWRDKARRERTTWSDLLRQRIKVWAWVRAGRPRLREWKG